MAHITAASLGARVPTTLLLGPPLCAGRGVNLWFGWVPTFVHSPPDGLWAWKKAFSRLGSRFFPEFLDSPGISWRPPSTEVQSPHLSLSILRQPAQAPAWGPTLPEACLLGIHPSPPLPQPASTTENHLFCVLKAWKHIILHPHRPPTESQFPIQTPDLSSQLTWRTEELCCIFNSGLAFLAELANGPPLRRGVILLSHKLGRPWGHPQTWKRLECLPSQSRPDTVSPISPLKCSRSNFTSKNYAMYYTLKSQPRVTGSHTRTQKKLLKSLISSFWIFWWC